MLFQSFLKKITSFLAKNENSPHITKLANDKQIRHEKWLKEKVRQFDEVMSLNAPNLNVRQILENASTITFLYVKGAHSFRGHNPEILFTNKVIKYIDDPDWLKTDLFICMAFGIETPEGIFEKIKQRGIPILVEEETFMRSVTPSTGKPDGCPAKFIDAVSHFFDARAPHFYTGAISSLERMLNSVSLNLSEEQLSDGEKKLAEMLSCYLSKYNSQPIIEPNLPNNNKKNILVIDQVKGDMAVTLNDGSEKDFQEMIDAAVNENPDCNIIVKSHVDMRRGYLSQEYIKKEVILYSEPINMTSLLKKIDKVYVYSSAAGMEAIFLDKDVHVFGSPIYAGWGLTNDRRSFPKRTRTRNKIELFYIIYVLYSFYCDPLTREKCDFDEAIKILISLRNQYFDQYSISK